jgi:hypothetical protein
MIIKYTIDGFEKDKTRRNNLFEISTLSQVGRSLLNELKNKGYKDLFIKEKKHVKRIYKFPLKIKSLGITIAEIIFEKEN